MTSQRPVGELLHMDLPAGEMDWKPTPHGRFLAQVLAEHDFVSGREVLELGAGVANHTVIMLRRGAKRLVATEVARELIETTRANVEANCSAEEADRVEYRVADWLATEGEFDVVVTNPPFARSGKQNRRYFLDSLILDAHKRLRPGGLLVFVQSSMADLAKTLRRLDENGFDAKVVDETSGPFRGYYFEDPAFMAEIERVPNGYTRAPDGSYRETLYVVAARLRGFTPHENAHVV